jgi:hypothetical protein
MPDFRRSRMVRRGRRLPRGRIGSIPSNTSTASQFKSDPATIQDVRNTRLPALQPEAFFLGGGIFSVNFPCSRSCPTCLSHRFSEWDSAHDSIRGWPGADPGEFLIPAAEHEAVAAYVTGITARDQILCQHFWGRCSQGHRPASRE